MIKTKRITVYDKNGEARNVLPREAEILKKTGIVTDKKENKAGRVKKEEKVQRMTKEEKSDRTTK